ncbi:hypothetical protein 2 [Beihai sesarmid crab virus 1]|uniref:hypothetical protein 2 n=1 Tax=Beihai sesarmid crab virus 1 TaxID=1922661 RepID=UPI00090C4351|nr:hypothetical protein 2 [Beihai sesarmid crab virus 1]APG78029.1 hypothetical protein 2 [Beihai sesarmid crab virus 1]
MDPRSLRSNIGICGFNLPVASEEVNMLFQHAKMFCVSFLLTYCTYSISQIEPQASEAPKSLTQQNVKFSDANPGYDNDTFTPMDPTRSLSMAQDVDMGNFLARPLNIASINWQAGGPSLNENFNPWELFFTHPTIAGRINNYRLMQAKLCVKFLINGNSFLYGRAICSYTPLVLYDSLTRVRPGVQEDLVGASQRPHVYLDPCTSQGGVLTLPYLNPFQSNDVVVGDFFGMGAINVADLTPLLHANGASDDVTITVLAWAESVKLSIPTAHDTLSADAFVPQASSKPKNKPDEYGKGPISRPASAVAAIASKLTFAPYIGPFAKATELAASATSAIASLFGYSRPVMVDTQMSRLISKGTIANSNMQDDVQKLSLDVKQELTIDSKVDGSCGEDEMDILRIAQHESFVVPFTWNGTAPPNALLFNTVVTPAMYRYRGSGDSTELHLTAPAYAALPFKYWRGTIRYRFQIVASKFHRGRLRFVYDPYGTTSTTPDYNKVYSTIVDLSDTSDFTIDCGWGQTTLWREVGDYTNPEVLTFDGAPLFWDAYNETNGNGTLSVYVVNELTAATNVSPSINVNVFVSVGDDFEVAVPESRHLTRLRVSNPAKTIGPYAPDSILVEPQALEEEKAPIVDDNPDSPEAENAIRLAPSTDPNDFSHLIHFGEVFKSFRSLLKRYMMHESIPAQFSTSGASVYVQAWRFALPFAPGVIDNAPSDSPALDTTDGKYVYGYMTHLKYLTLAHVGWKGGVRWLIDNTSLQCCNSVHNSPVVSRANGCRPTNSVLVTGTVGSYGTPGSNSIFYNRFKELTGFEGAAIHSMADQPYQNFEVPFYSTMRFAPARAKDDFEEFDGAPYMPCWKYGYVIRTKATEPTGTDSLRMNLYAAAAEDFNVSFYLGPPPFYIELTPPGLSP